LRSLAHERPSQPALSRHLLDHNRFVSLREVAVALDHGHCSMTQNVSSLEQARTLAREVDRACVSQIVKAEVLDAGRLMVVKVLVGAREARRLLKRPRAVRTAYSMPGVGLEPTWGYPQGILSPLRLPISPPGQ
jgi:hypothetical protein